jgi:hypothetical protein
VFGGNLQLHHNLLAFAITVPGLIKSTVLLLNNFYHKCTNDDPNQVLLSHKITTTNTGQHYYIRIYCIPWKSLRHTYELFFARIYRSLPEREASFYICVNILKFGQESSAAPQSRNKLLNQRSLHPRVRWQERSVAASVTWHSLFLFGKQCTWTLNHLLPYSNPHSSADSFIVLFLLIVKYNIYITDTLETTER